MAYGDDLELRGDVQFGDGDADDVLISGRTDQDITWHETSGIAGLGLPEWRDTDEPSDGDGDLFGTDRLQGRVITATDVAVTTRAAARLLRTAMRRRTTDAAWCFRGMGPAPTDTTDLLAWVRPRHNAHLEDALAHRFEEFGVDLEWKAADPRLYAVTEVATTVSGSNPTVANNGTEPAPFRWVVTATGGVPCVGPRLRRMDDPTVLLLDFDGLSIPTGQTLVVDTRAGTAMLNGTQPVIGRMQDGSGRFPAAFWDIPVGGESVGYAADSGATTSVVYVRDTYL